MLSFIVALSFLFLSADCRAQATHTIVAFKQEGVSPWANEPQIEVGQPNFIVDSVGNIIGIPKKIIMFNPQVDNHHISDHTVEMIRQYIKDNPNFMKGTKVRFNQFTPVGEFKRLIRNKKISWWWRIFPGIPTTVFSLAGRLVGGDHYNPYTDTINIYSDIPAIALHEAGHAVDTDKKFKEGWADYYTLGRFFLPVTLHQEYEASREAIEYVEKKGDYKEEKAAYQTLYPAYGTYVGGSIGIPYGDVVGAGVGHVVSITPQHNRRLTHQALDEAVWSGEIIQGLVRDPLAKSLMDDRGQENKIFQEEGFLEGEKLIKF